MVAIETKWNIGDVVRAEGNVYKIIGISILIQEDHKSIMCRVAKKDNDTGKLIEVGNIYEEQIKEANEDDKFIFDI